MKGFGEVVGKKAQDFIDAYEAFCRSINTPIRLSESDIYSDQESNIVDNLNQNKVSGAFFPQNEEIYRKMLNLMF